MHKTPVWVTLANNYSAQLSLKTTEPFCSQENMLLVLFYIFWLMFPLCLV